MRARPHLPGQRRPGGVPGVPAEAMVAAVSARETPTQKAERLAAEWSPVLQGPIGMAECGCPNRIDGSAPALHICRRCGFEGGFASVHVDCAGCAYLAETK